MLTPLADWCFVVFRSLGWVLLGKPEPGSIHPQRRPLLAVEAMTLVKGLSSVAPVLPAVRPARLIRLCTPERPERPAPGAFPDVMDATP
jgi:hypothetical protein